MVVPSFAMNIWTCPFAVSIFASAFALFLISAASYQFFASLSYARMYHCTFTFVLVSGFASFARMFAATSLLT